MLLYPLFLFVLCVGILKELKKTADKYLIMVLSMSAALMTRKSSCTDQSHAATAECPERFLSWSFVVKGMCSTDRAFKKKSATKRT